MIQQAIGRRMLFFCNKTIHRLYSAPLLMMPAWRQLDYYMSTCSRILLIDECIYIV